MVLILVLGVLAFAFVLVTAGVEWTARQLSTEGPCCPDGRCRGKRG